MNAPVHHQSSYDRLGNACRIYANQDGSICIRLQDSIDSVTEQLREHSNVKDRSSFPYDIIQKKLTEIQAKLLASSNSDDVSLYPRSWRSITHSQNATTDTRHHTSHVSNKNSLTVATFNALAQGLSSGPNSIFQPPFYPYSESFDGTYGGFTHLMNNDPLNYELRKWRLLHVVLGGGMSSGDFFENISEEITSASTNVDHLEQCWVPFDILALQEVDNFHSFWKPLLVCDPHSCSASDQTECSTAPGCIKKYQAVFQPKPFSPCVRFGWYSDGVALMWNMDKFRTLERPTSSALNEQNQSSVGVDTGDGAEYWIEMGAFQGDAICDNITSHDPARLAARSQVYIIVPLLRTGTDQIVIAASTHLKAKKGGLNERIRHLQALELKQRVNQLIKTLQIIGWRDIQVVVLGDFNSEPDDLSVQCILQPEHGSSWKMQSAYPLHDENHFTTWKSRKDGSVCRTIDYIFYSQSSEKINSEADMPSNRLQCNDILSVPERESMNELLPGFRYPSDHMLMAARFD